MAERGRETLRHGPMKPVGLTNPHDPDGEGLRHRAAAPGQQARHALQHGRLPDQAEARRAAARVPHHSGLESAEFARLGGLHRNTFLNSPKLLDRQLRLRAQPRLRFAGQMTGCEGYVESASIGLIAGPLCRGGRTRAVVWRRRRRPRRSARCSAISPAATSRPIDAGPRSFQPMNINFGLFPPLAAPPTKKPDGIAAARQREDGRQEAGDERPGARRSRPLDRRPSARSGSGVTPWPCPNDDAASSVGAMARRRPR